MAIRWLPANSESEMIKAFEKFATPICHVGCDKSEPVSLVGQLLLKRFPGHWLLVFHGVNDPLISIQ